MKANKIIPRPIACAALLILSAMLLGILSGCGMIIINTPSSGTTAATTVSPETQAPEVTTDPAEQTDQTEPPLDETTEPPETARPIDPVVFPDRFGEAEERLAALDDPVGISDFDLIIASASNTTDVIFCDDDSPLYEARSQRNAMLYEKFEVDIRTIYENADSERIYDDLLLALQAGDNVEVYLDLIIIPANQVGRFLSKGLIKDMRSLPFYSMNAGSNSGNVGSARYADFGDGTDAPEYLHVLYFNRALLGEETSKKLYSAALDSSLTFESIAEAAKAIDSRVADIGLAEGAGLLGDLSVSLAGISYINKDTAGTPKLEISDTDLQLIDQLIEGVSKLTVYQQTENVANSFERFKGGEIPFYLGTVADMLDLYDEKILWGMLSLPSEKDLGAISDNRPAVCLPVTGTSLEQTSIWLEGFNAASGDWIRDSFLQKSIESYLPDNSSCLTMAKILSQKAEIGFDRVFAGYYDGLADATHGGAGEAMSGNVRYSEIYSKKLSALNKKLSKLP